MTIIKHVSILFLAVGFALGISAQNYPINAASNGTTVNTCQGTIYDSGGPAGNYGNSEFFTVTFCSSNGSPLILDVTQFNIENFFDDLFIYDGPSNGSPLLAQGTGNQLAGQSFTSTGTCVTLVFDTDGSVTSAGFAIDISCSFPCQAIEPQITLDPLLNLSPDDDILSCLGTQVQFSGNALFPENGLTYIQSTASSTFEWYVNGTLAFTGQDFLFEPATPGLFQVELVVTDLEGCTNAITVSQNVLVTGMGNFSGTTIDVPPICAGEQVDLTGSYSNEPIFIDVQQQNDISPGNPLFFPGGPIELSSDLTVSGFLTGQTITDIDQIDAICIVMEHSWVGDLDITVICPSGTEVILLDDEFGGNNLGTTNNGFEYCFSPDVPPGNTLDYQGINPIPAGQYAPFEPMDAFEGCDLNGTWEIVINDNLFADDGFLFDWYIQFDEDFVGNQNAMPETILSSQWAADPTIIADNVDQITVQPDAPGQYCYTYEVTTDFCVHDTTICIEVEAGPAILFDPVDLLCSGQDPIALAATPTGGIWSGAAAADGSFDPTTAGSYWAIYETLPSPGTCPSVDSLELTVAPAPTATISGGGAICNGSDASVSITMDVSDDWTVVYAIDGVDQAPLLFNGLSTSFDTGTDGTYTLVSASNGICEATLIGSVEVIIEAGPELSITGDVSLCPGASAEFLVEFEGVAPFTFAYAIDGIGQGSITTSDNPYLLTANEAGTYTITSFNTQNCIGTVSGQAQLSFFPAPEAVISGDADLCQGEEAQLQIDFIGTGPYSFEYALDGVGQGLVLINDNPYTFATSVPGTYTLLSFSDTNCSGTVSGQAQVEFLPSPSATMSGGGTICPNSDTQISIDFEGNPPYQFEYFLDGISQGLVNTSMDPFILTTGVGGEYSFSDFSDANCPGTASGTASIEVLDEPTATISGGGSICPGEEVEITVSFQGTGPYTFEYSVEGISFGPITTDEALYTFTVGTTGTYTILSFFTENCIGAGNGQAVVVATPAPSAVFAQSDLSICPNEVNSASINLGGAGPWTVDWSIDGDPQASIVTPISPYILDIEEAGTYTIEEVSSGNCSSLVNSELEVTVFDLPTAVLSGGEIVCPGAAGELSLAFTGTGPWTVEYSMDGLPSGTETFADSTSIWSVFAEGQYMLTSVSDANCSNTASGTAQLDFYELPDAAFLDEQETICEGDSYDFTVELSGTAPYTLSYTLNGQVQPEITSSGDQIVLSAAVAGIYTLQDITDAYCSTSLNSSVELDFHPPLSASVQGPALFCVGDTISLSALLQGGSGEDVTFIWTDGDGQLFEGQALDYPIVSSQWFTLTVNDACNVPFTTEEELFAGQAYPQPEVLAEMDSVCAGGAVSFTHLDEIGPASCIWNFGDGSTAIGCGTITAAFVESGPLSLTLTTATTAGCSSTLVMDTLVQVLAVPEADFDFRPNPGNIYAPSVLFFNASSDATDYLWNFGDGTISEEVSPRHDFPGGDAMDYVVCLEAINDLGCADFTCAFVPIESIFTVHIPNAFTPDGDAINDCFAPVINDVELAEYEFMVYDAWGHEVYRSGDRNACWNGRGAEDENYYAGTAIYSYRLLVRAVDTVEKLEFNGTVVLVR